MKRNFLKIIMGFFLKIIIVITPWKIRRLILNKLFMYDIHPTARIGLSWIFPNKLTMEAGSRIDHFTVAIHLDHIEMKQNTSIGRSNWITGFSTFINSPHFQHQKERQSKLVLGDSSAITKNHHIDCTNLVEIGRFSTIAGYNSQLLTHSVNVFDNRQDSKPIKIGDYVFVGTNCVILGGASIPSNCVLGAKSMLSKNYSKEWQLYAGVPAEPVKVIPKEAKYFSRDKGYIY